MTTGWLVLTRPVRRGRSQRRPIRKDGY